ncbi:MAG: hypothetical protein OQK97_10005, partial [Deltaproteobacteria bacterium]|nr:hypothetical protein [Deltaproteobacteria bacterium]
MDIKTEQKHLDAAETAIPLFRGGGFAIRISGGFETSKDGGFQVRIAGRFRQEYAHFPCLEFQGQF